MRSVAVSIQIRPVGPRVAWEPGGGPVAVGRDRAGGGPPADRVGRSIAALVDDRVRAEPGSDLVDADAVVALRDVRVLDEVEARAGVVDGVELEGAVEVDTVHYLEQRRTNQQHV